MPAASGNAVDTIPLAVAFQEVVHAVFRGSNEDRLVFFFLSLLISARKALWRSVCHLEKVPSSYRRGHDALVPSRFDPAHQLAATRKYTAHILSHPQLSKLGKRCAQQAGAEHVSTRLRAYSSLVTGIDFPLSLSLSPLCLSFCRSVFV